MKIKNAILRLVACACLLGLTASCTTTYDAYGRPQQSVDPVLATAGIVAAGAIGYAIANNRDHHGYRRSYSSGYGGGRYYRGGGYSHGGYRGNRCHY